MPRRERMTSVDTAWLRMDRPHNLMMIVGVLTLERRPDFTKLKRIFAERFLAWPRFRQRPVTDATGASWEDDPDFDLARHVVRARLSGKADDRALERLAGRLAVTPLDPAHPMWQMTVVENYDGGAAIVARIHHAYADGIALIGVMLSLTDRAPGAAPADRRRPPRPDPEAPSVLQQLLEPFGGVVSAAAKLSSEAIEKSLEILRHPTEVVDYARLGASVAGEVAQLALMPADATTRFKGKPGPAKRVAWSEPIPLDAVKAAGNAFGCSVNDILLASAAGALRRYLDRHGDHVDGIELRALVPVNLRRPTGRHELGNRFGLVALLLPVGMANPVARVHAVHERMEALKGSHQAVVTLGLLGLMGMCPQAVQEQILDTLASKASAVMTNVPGPQEQLYVAGTRLTSMMFWVPQSGDIGMGVSILSYNGTVRFGLITDAKLVPDPARIVAQFRPEFEKLLVTALMEPWETRRDPSLIDEELAAAERALRERAAPARRAPRRTDGKATRRVESGSA